MDKRVRYALEYKDLVMRAADLLESSIKVNLQALQADNDKRAMDVMTEERDEQIESKKQELATGPLHRLKISVPPLLIASIDLFGPRLVGTVQAEYAMLVQSGKQLKAVAEDRINSLTPALRDRVETRRAEDLPLAQLQDDRTDIETNLNCMQAVSPAVLEAFKKRQREVRPPRASLWPLTRLTRV